MSYERVKEYFKAIALPDLMAGDAKVNSSKFKSQFHQKPAMVPWEELEKYFNAVGWVDVCKGWYVNES